MATATKEKLSASTDGKAIKVAATATPGTTIHTAHATLWDEIHIEAFNSDTVPRVLTIERGSATAPDDNIVQTIPPQSGLVVVISDLILTNSLVTKAFCPTTNVIQISGFVNRITN